MVTQVTSLARNGVGDWIIQRVSAVVLLLFFAVVVGFILVNSGEITYETWKTFFGYTHMRILGTATVLSLAAHAWIGMWAVGQDYLTTRMLGDKGNTLRFLFLLFCAVVSFVYLVWGLLIFWS